MGGTNVNQTSTQTPTLEPVTGNVGAGATLTNSSVMPLDLAGGNNNTVSVTSLDPQAIAAAVGLANSALNSNAQVMEMATQANELVTSGVVAQSGQLSTKALDLAGQSTGSGPVNQVLATAGKYAVAGFVLLGLILMIAFGGRKKREANA
jgi:hypothetical protein